jgi:tetratricopeptide (TPR) repeat protein
MDLADRSIALYGRFTPGVRDRLAAAIERAGGQVARDLTRRSDALVVGALAFTLIDSGALAARLKAAGARAAPILSERAFQDALEGEGQEPATATLPLATALRDTALTREDAGILAAFDLIRLEGDNCRFGDAGPLRTAAELIAHGRSRADAVRILTRARDLSPTGRHRIVLTPEGDAALKWGDEESLTTLEGQGVLPLQLDEAHASLDDLFEAAAIAEARDQPDEAARLYDLCARADRKDAIALYNLANLRLQQARHDDAVMAYQRALARDPRLIEARYNLAQALEAKGDSAGAEAELARVLDAEPRHGDAVFNLAQLRLKAGQMREAKGLYERYLSLDPPADWAATARRAIMYCAARLAG